MLKTKMKQLLTALTISTAMVSAPLATQAADKGLEIIDLSLGSSDLNPPQEAIEALQAAVIDKSTYGYCLHTCTRAFRQEAALWYERKFANKINPEKEVLPLIGSQEGLANLLLAMLPAS